MCMQVFTIGFDLSLVLKIGIKSIFYKVACLRAKSLLHTLFFEVLAYNRYDDVLLNVEVSCHAISFHRVDHVLFGVIFALLQSH